jgi:hypothetical protein
MAKGWLRVPRGHQLSAPYAAGITIRKSMSNSERIPLGTRKR